jgi:prepilin-type N-terminal cleavage/methylation domain-containing protein
MGDPRRVVTYTTVTSEGKYNLKLMVHFGKEGFTLTEILVAFVILAVGILAIAVMQVASTKSGYFSNNITQATILAQDKLEYLKNLSYRHSDLSSGEHNEGTISGTIFSRQHAIVEDAGNSFKTITVTVQWADRGNHSISFSTIRSK